MHQKSKMAAIVKYQLFKFMFTNMEFYHKHCWNMLYPCQTECLKLKIVDLYTPSAGGKATGKQIFDII